MKTEIHTIKLKSKKGFLPPVLRRKSATVSINPNFLIVPTRIKIPISKKKLSQSICLTEILSSLNLLK